LVLRKNEIAELIEGRLSKLTKILNTSEKTEVHFTQSGALISRLVSRFTTAQLLSATQGSQNCFLAGQQISLESEQLHRIRSLKSGLLSDKIKANNTLQEAYATHLLHEDHAWSLATAVSIYLKNDQLSIKSGADENATLVVVVKDSELSVLHQQPGFEVILPRDCQPGSAIVFAGHKINLIEVNHA
jgi:hypothetical protein